LDLLELDLIRVIGKAEPSRIFTLLDTDASAENALAQFRARHAEMLERYRAQDWDAAEAALQRAQTTGESLGLGAYYRMMGERIVAFRVDPPPADWDGVADMVSK
jgi:adenylate cyclase